MILGALYIEAINFCWEMISVNRCRRLKTEPLVDMFPTGGDIQKKEEQFLGLFGDDDSDSEDKPKDRPKDRSKDRPKDLDKRKKRKQKEGYIAGSIDLKGPWAPEWVRNSRKKRDKRRKRDRKEDYYHPGNIMIGGDVRRGYNASRKKGRKRREDFAVSDELALTRTVYVSEPWDFYRAAFWIIVFAYFGKLAIDNFMRRRSAAV
jgi:hypothetical protein